MEKDFVTSVEKKFDYYKDKEFISNSMLSWMKVSSAYFKKMFDEYPNEDEEDSQYLIFGNAFHCFNLEPNEFYKRYAILEQSAPVNVVQRKFFDALISTKQPLDSDYKKEDIISVYESVYAVKGKSKDVIESSALDLYSKNKSYIDFITKSQDKIPISREEVNRIESMRKSIMDHEVAKTLIFDSFLEDGWLSENEKALFFHVDLGAFRIPMKCKVDRIIWNKKLREIIIIDLKTNSLKTTRKSYIEQLKEDILTEYDYDRQAAVYRKAVRENLGLFLGEDIGDYHISNYLVVSQSNIISETRVILLSEDTISLGNMKMLKLLEDYKTGLTYGFDHDSFYYLTHSKVLVI